MENENVDVDRIIKSTYNDGKYLQDNSNWHQEDSPYKASFVRKMIERNKISFKTCADLGCGAGLVTKLLAESYPESCFTGLDLSKDAEPFWEKNLTANIEFHRKSLSDMERQYDLIICLDVFEHVEDYFGFLRSMKPYGKKFIFNIPLDMNVVKVLTNGIKIAREDVGHLHYYNQYTAKETLRDCGYQIEDSFLSPAFAFTVPRNFRQWILLPFRMLTLGFGKRAAAKLFGGVSLVIVAE